MNQNLTKDLGGFDVWDRYFARLAENTNSTQSKGVEIMGKRYYRVKKENFLWHVGAIIQKEDNNKGYEPLDNTKLWDISQDNGGQWLLAQVVENSPDYFEEVYPVHLLTKTVFKLKEEARIAFSENFK